MSKVKLGDLVGQTIDHIKGGKVGDEELVFETAEGYKFRFYHSQDCCESVDIAEVIGDLEDLKGDPILVAESPSSGDHDPPAGEYVDSYTWTFYRFQTIKGSVTVRWLGQSNGYYGETPTLVITNPTGESDWVY